MKDKKKTIVMFGDSLTDYFPMDKLKDIDADIINSGVAGDTIAEMGARLSYESLSISSRLSSCKAGSQRFPNVCIQEQNH